VPCSTTSCASPIGGPGTTRSTPAGADRVFGGTRADDINVATAGPRSTAQCGSGNDVVRYDNTNAS
jgi:hypothetical protein